MYKYELSIVIPFYNEEENIKNVVNSLVNELNRNKINYELILVNNGSSDSTKQIIEHLRKKNIRIKQVDIQKNLGYGWGIINGLNTAKGSYIGFIDGDNQVHPQYLIDAYNKIKKTNAAICITRRLKRPNNFRRQFASIGYNTLINILFFPNVWDINSKPKVIQQKFYKELCLSSKDWFIDTEIVLKAKRKKFKIVEIPIIYNKRRKGKSKVKFAIVKEFLQNISRFLFK